MGREYGAEAPTQIAFAPYVSDYSRYLPENVCIASTFWATYLGCTIGSPEAGSNFPDYLPVASPDKKHD